MIVLLPRVLYSKVFVRQTCLTHVRDDVLNVVLTITWAFFLLYGLSGTGKKKWLKSRCVNNNFMNYSCLTLMMHIAAANNM